jgi:oligopeptidase A
MNPLLCETALPDYAAIRPEHAEPALREQISRNRAALAALLTQPALTFASLVEPFEALQARLGRVFAPIAHLNAVQSEPALRAAYNACLEVLTDYQSEVGQNAALAQAYADVLAAEGPALSDAGRRVLQHALREFELAGVRLPEAPQARYRAVMQELAQLQSRFEEQVLDSTRAFRRWIEDEALLAGLPADVVAQARERAVAEGRGGWLFTLDQPTYLAVLTHAEAGALRQEFYQAWTTRAADPVSGAAGYDNGPVMGRILALRHELAQLLGYTNYAELSLATKMARSVPEVIDFLDDLAARYRPAAVQEFAALSAYAGAELHAWDVPYYADRLRREQHSVSEEELRPWFPLPQVLKGLYLLIERLYGLSMTARNDMTLWHPDARYLELRDRTGQLVGGLYTDYYARDGKRAGAWMGEIANRQQLAGDTRLPVANVVCNFSPPRGNQPALLRHNDVVTLFHEFGHALHHLLTEVDYPSLAGINGVPWDVVELPSQLMEQWAWREEVLPMVSAHVDDGTSLPPERLQQLLGSRTFHAGLAAVRQLEFALFDFRLHADTSVVEAAGVQTLLDRVRATVGVIPAPSFNCFQHSFMHIFSGGYAAGYYSYKWAEVLAADAFAAFDEAGVFDAQTADRFRRQVLARGGACDHLQAFIEFRGRHPEVEPLLRQDGLAA